LRHRAFHFQEFSQRYAVGTEEAEYAEARLQDRKNRQNSIRTNDPALQEYWQDLQTQSWECDYERYQDALDKGIAKELARKLLPEGLTQARLYMQGTIRDWIHYLSVRTGNGTQLEHALVAWEIYEIFASECPTVAEAAQHAGVIPHD
jgi:thymidylate synthase (FAD)